MRARRHVDPDPHASSASIRAERERRRLLLDVPLVPEREREQAPELAAPVLAPGDVLVEQARHRLGRKKPCRSSVAGGERLARERLELAAQPRRRGDREAALAAVHDLARHQRLRRPCAAAPSSTARAPCAASAARTRSSSRPGRGTGRAPRASAPSTRGRSSRAGRRRGRCRSRRPAAARAVGALGLGVARAVDVDRIEACARGRSARRARPAEKISFQPWWRSSGGRCAARTNRFAL